MVFYRKYRPQKIEELDNEKIRETFYRIFANENYPHAFLFSGPKGLGKTSAARIIAKVVNCERKAKRTTKSKLSKNQVEPCSKCNQCVSIANGTNIDVLEIDAASNRGIDEIRDLREKIKLSPASARKKVYIIDEVHMLTTEAFNALLKTLEEPPNHALFVLCTTEPHKILQTITSRCFQINFKKATREELIRAFERIAKVEKIKIDKEALEAIAGLSDGSFRDGVKILEEILSLSLGKKITKETVEKKHSITNINLQILEFINAFETQDIKSGLNLIGKIADSGVDLKFFAQAFIEKLHKLLLGKVGINDEKEETSLSMSELKELMELFNRAYLETRYSVIVQLPFEMAIINWGEREMSNDKQETEDRIKPEQTVGKKTEPKKAIEHQQPRLLGKNEAFWGEVIERMKGHNHTIAGVLRGANLHDMEKKMVTIETGYKFHKEKLSELKTLQALEEVCSQIAGKKMAVSIILKQKGR
ncbi:MAG: DNA polymerase III, subunit gamma and tau [Candidatus Levybacteria bacterium RBG_16_35_11]|nr:MAG: DNA polymerase III, subunit gamma and tau [Candidatus Levybacteria bacterium RBG_16_35_11]